jgi:uncharacterized OB-fold protein
MPAELEILAFPGHGPAAPLLPAPTADTEPFHAGLREGHLALQRCERCERARYPLAPVCPYCNAAEHRWEQLDGRGSVHSWVRYHRAFHAAFAPLLPYVVVSVELAAGPRMFGRLVGDGEPSLGMPAQMIVERWEDGGCVPAFLVREEEA